MDRLVGSSNEVDVVIGEDKVSALLDTGSMISTISESLSNKLGLDVHPVQELLSVEGVGGHQLNYLGYVETTLFFPDLHMELDVLMLVVNDTSYHERIPLLLGTNILQVLLGKHEGRADLPHNWQLTFKAISLLSRLKEKPELAEVKSTKSITIPPEGRFVIHGHTRISSCMRLTAMTEEFHHKALPGGLRLSPTVFHLESGKSSHRVPIEISNFSSRTITIPPKMTLCSLQQVQVTDQKSYLESSSKGDAGPRVNAHTSDTPVGQEDVSDTDFLSKFNPSYKDSLTSSQVQTLEQLLIKWKEAFSLHEFDLGCTKLTKHSIKLVSNIPFKERPRKIPPAMVDEVRAHLKEMLDLGVIENSNSPYSSNVVLVRKPDGSLRFCLDLRKLNSMTIRDAFPLPRIEDTLEALEGSCWFSVLDLRSGFWQVELEEQDKCKTAFSVGNLGFFQSTRMCFGLTNAPATFQRLMESCMGDLYLTYCLLYLDDVIVFSTSFEEHLSRLEAVFARLKDAGLKLKQSKCRFFQKSIKYLGHIVSQNGVSTDPEKVRSVEEWPIPKSVAEVQSFLGFVGFYRRFIQDFAKIARPLHELTQGQGSKKKGRKKKPPRTSFQWNQEHQQAFEKLIKCVTTAPVLGFANYKIPFELYTDASGEGLGAILYQTTNGQKRVIAYASRCLSKAEKNYPAHKLEFLALKWAICEKFHDYLYGSSFTAYTDNNPLTYALQSAKLDATGHRWVSQLANYNFSIHYRSGRQNTDADALSRIRIPEDLSPSLKASVVQATLEAAELDLPIAETICCHADVVTNDVPDDPDMSALSLTEMKDAQLEDDCICEAIKFLDGTTSSVTTREARRLLKDAKRLILEDGILFRKRCVDAGDMHQLVLPRKFREAALIGCHDDVGHLGRDRTIALLQDRFYWPAMSSEATDYVSKCGRCVRRKTLPNQRAPLVTITSSQPMELVCIDFLKLEQSRGGIENVLVVTDHFSKYGQAYLCRN